jgi:hypothetical protein
MGIPVCPQFQKDVQSWLFVSLFSCNQKKRRAEPKWFRPEIKGEMLKM